MDVPHTQERLDPTAEPVEKPVEVHATMMRIHELSIDRPAILAYLQTIPPGKQEIALVHALEVGVTELIARRGRIRH